MGIPPAINAVTERCINPHRMTGWTLNALGIPPRISTIASGELTAPLHRRSSRAHPGPTN
jgi:hypothetical protein